MYYRDKCGSIKEFSALYSPKLYFISIKIQCRLLPSDKHI